MSLADAAPPQGGATGELRRFGTPALLLVVEFAALSLLVDFPMTGPAMGLVTAARMLVPVVIGTASAGLIIARHRPGGAPTDLGRLPAPRFLPALGAHAVAFAATAALAYRLMGPRAPPLSPAAFLTWLALVGVTILLAVGVAVPPLALLRLAGRHLSTPLFATGVGLLTWRGVAAVEQVWGLLQVGTLRATGALLGLVAHPVHVNPLSGVIGVGAFDVAVAPVCSGVDGVGLVVLFQALWISLARSRVRMGRALLLLVPAGVMAALTANVLRIAGLILVGASGHEDLAMGAFHSKLGWLFFIAIAFASIAVAERVGWLHRQASSSEAAWGLPPAAAAYVGPLIAALAIALATSLWAQDGLDPLYGARVLGAALVLVLGRRSLPRPALAPSWTPLVVAAVVTAFWAPWGGTDESKLAQAVAGLDPATRTAWIAIRLVGGCLVLPVAEELAFRGFLLPWLVSPEFEKVPPRTWSWPAIGLSSLAFGAVHDQWILGTAAGVAFAFARLWRGRLGDAVLAHVACNSALSLIVLLRGRWDLWG